MPGSTPDDFQRVGQSGKVIVQAKELAPESPQLFGDGRPLDEARVADRHHRRRGRNPLPVEKCDWLTHGKHYSGTLTLKEE